MTCFFAPGLVVMMAESRLPKSDTLEREGLEQVAVDTAGVVHLGYRTTIEEDRIVFVKMITYLGVLLDRTWDKFWLNPLRCVRRGVGICDIELG